MLTFEQLEDRRLLSLTLTTGDHYLLPDTADQVIPVYVSGTGDAVEACNLNVQIADGGPELGGSIDGPTITDIDLLAWIFAGNNMGQVDPEWVSGSVVHTFEISNTGGADLVLTGSPLVQIAGENAGDFTVIRQPDAVIPPNGTTSFDIEFRPLGTGLRTATVVVPNNDPDEDPYDFAIQGTGVDGDQWPQWEGRFTITESGSIEIVGTQLLAYITVDTTGFTSGSWGLILGEGNLNGTTDFAGEPATVINGTIMLNSPPVAVADAFTGLEDSGISGNLIANDSDPDGDGLTAVLVTGPEHGTLTLSDDGAFVYTPDADWYGTDTFTYYATDGHWSTEATVTLTVEGVQDVLAEYLVYGGSYWDGNGSVVDAADLFAVATDKTPLKDGGTASYSNVSNYVKGINELLFVVDSLSTPVDADQFACTVGNSDDVSTWSAAPAPTVTVLDNFGDNGEDLVFLSWADGAISGQWLRVEWTAQEVVSYWGSAPGDTTGDFKTDASDLLAVRRDPHIWINPAGIENPNDVNRDSLVNATDMVLARRHATTAMTALKAITPTASVAALDYVFSSIRQSDPLAVRAEVALATLEGVPAEDEPVEATSGRVDGDSFFTVQEFANGIRGTAAELAMDLDLLEVA